MNAATRVPSNLIQSAGADYGDSKLDHQHYFPPTIYRVAVGGRRLEMVAYEMAVIIRAAVGLRIPTEGCLHAASVLSRLRRDGLDLVGAGAAIRDTGLMTSSLDHMDEEVAHLSYAGWRYHPRALGTVAGSGRPQRKARRRVGLGKAPAAQDRRTAPRWEAPPLLTALPCRYPTQRHRPPRRLPSLERLVPGAVRLVRFKIASASPADAERWSV